MDVLYTSIDVRDLLSSPDIDDPSTPLSAPDLRLLIDRLQVRSVHIKSRVHEYIRSHQSDFSCLFSQSFDIFSGSEQLSIQLFNLLSLISDNPIDTKIKFIIEEIVTKRKEVREKRELLELLGVFLEFSENLRVVKEDIEVGKVEVAAEALRQLKSALRVNNDGVSVSEEEDGKLAVYQLLKEEWTECFEKMQDLLISFIETAVSFEPESNRLRVQYRLSMNVDGGIDLHTVLKAMDAVGILDYGFARVADLMIKHIIGPATKNRSTVSSAEEINKDQGQISDAILNFVSSSDPMSDGLDGETMYSTLSQIVEFINKSLCFQTASWMHCFGRLTWPRMSELIISNFLSKIARTED